MGEKIDDRYFKDNDKTPEIDGLGLLPVTTVFADDKTTARRAGRIIHPSFTAKTEVSGYEIHFGETTFNAQHEGFEPLFELDGRPDGAADADLRRAGTYLHNAFHNDIFRNEWLNIIRAAKGLPSREPIRTTKEKEIAYNALAAAAIKNLDIDYLLKEIIGIEKR